MKKITLIIDGKEIEAQVNEEDLKELEKKNRRAEEGSDYYTFSSLLCKTIKRVETKGNFSDSYYNSGNYFLTEKECADAARVVRLWLQLKRFADKHNDIKHFTKIRSNYYIVYNHSTRKIEKNVISFSQDLFQIYFDSAENAQKAIDEFHDELMWYFTEYGKES